MKISCVCPTHGRAHVIGEAVESFRRQTYGGDMEMLILNDCPEQPLSCDVPGVRIINLPEPIPDASLKFNRAVEEADGDLIAWWEDDDISLPLRLEYSERLWKTGMRDELQYVKVKKAFLWKDQRIDSHAVNLFFGASLFSREYYLSVGGAVAGDWPDMSAHNAMAVGCCEFDVIPELTWFIYRWGGPVHHDSGAGIQDGATRFRQFRERTLSHPRFRPGPQKIIPAWRRDYVSEVQKWIGANKEPTP